MPIDLYAQNFVYISGYMYKPSEMSKYDEMAFVTSRSVNKDTILALGGNHTVRDDGTAKSEFYTKY